MELHGVVLARGIFDGRLRVGAARRTEAGETSRLRRRGTSRRGSGGDAFEQGESSRSFDVGVAVLTLVAGKDLAAERVRHVLQPVTNAEHGQSELQHSSCATGASVSYTDEGPPERMMPAGAYLWISFSEAVQGSTTENTLCSRIRRAISCVYCEPKSRTTID